MRFIEVIRLLMGFWTDELGMRECCCGGRGETARLIDDARGLAGVLVVELATRSTVRAVDELVADMKLFFLRRVVGRAERPSPRPGDGFAEGREDSEEMDER